MGNRNRQMLVASSFQSLGVINEKTRLNCSSTRSWGGGEGGKRLSKEGALVGKA